MICPHCHVRSQFFIEHYAGDKDLVCLVCGFRKDLRYVGAPLEVIQLSSGNKYHDDIKIETVKLRRANIPYRVIRERIYNTHHQRPSLRAMRGWVKGGFPVA